LDVADALVLARESVKEHPLEVLEFAVRHGHTDLAAEAARQSMELEITAAMKALSPDTFKAWVWIPALFNIQ
jgi:hypothetical protein